MRQRLASLTSRLVVTTVALVLLVSVLIGTVTTVAMRHYLTGQLDDQVSQAMTRITEGPPYNGGAGALLGNPLGTVVVVTPDAGQPRGVLLAADRGDGRSHGEPLEGDLVEALGSIPPDDHPRSLSLHGLGHYRLLVHHFEGGNLAVGIPTTNVDDVVSNLIWWEALLALLALLGAAGAATVVVRRQLRPLREVASTAHTVAGLPLASGEIELAERVPERLTDARTEVGQVGSALNTLLAHVESSLAQRYRSEQQVRQFVADASHELRTPLTTIAGYTELARRRPDDGDAVRIALGKVEEESARMTSMVEDLLLLARLDSGRPLARDHVDLSRLLVEAVSDARVVAPDHRWRLELPEDSLEVAGDADRLHQVVTNLLTNARKHTPPGTTVTVTGGPSGFSVHDDGPGFPPGLAAAAFERFVRGDASRTRGGNGTAASPGGPAGSGSSSGAGLGLSLVDAIVTAHGGTVTLDTHPGSTTITVSLPG
jgi:two-component system OmpR family sensor kinase